MFGIIWISANIYKVVEEYKNAVNLYFEHKKKEQLSIVQSWASEYTHYKYLLTKSGHGKYYLKLFIKVLTI